MYDPWATHHILTELNAKPVSYFTCISAVPLSRLYRSSYANASIASASVWPVGLGLADNAAADGGGLLDRIFCCLP